MIGTIENKGGERGEKVGRGGAENAQEVTRSACGSAEVPLRRELFSAAPGGPSS